MCFTNVLKDKVSNHNEQFKKTLAANYLNVRDPMLSSNKWLKCIKLMTFNNHAIEYVGN